MSECPTCNGTGKVPAHVANALNWPGGLVASTDPCVCDGPPHTWSPGWCPQSGPVTR